MMEVMVPGDLQVGKWNLSLFYFYNVPFDVISGDMINILE